MLTITWITENFESEGQDIKRNEALHTLQFDAVTRENHLSSALLTEHTVESGLALSDHKRAQRRRVSIEAVVTNTPVGNPLPSGYGDAGNVTGSFAAQGEAKANVLSFAQEFNRKADVFDTLKRLTQEPTLVMIETDIETYENMTVTSVTNPRVAQDGESLRFTIEAIEVRVADAQLVESPEPRQARGRRSRDRGAQQGIQEGGTSTNNSRAQQNVDATRQALSEQPRSALSALIFGSN